MSLPDELLALATGVAHEAGAGLRDAFGRALEISAKSTPTDLVSEADVSDRAADPRAARGGAARRRDHGGGGRRPAGHERPALGRRPARRHRQLPLRHPAVVRAASRARTPRARSPASCSTRCAARPGRRRATARRRSTARRARRASATSSRTALVATGFGYDAAVRESQARVVARLLPRVRDVRRLGAAALDLAWTAAGRFDAYYERGVKHWDVAAGALICERAGLACASCRPRRPPTRAARRRARDRRRAARAGHRLIARAAGMAAA